jgi:hypothetical protein
MQTYHFQQQVLSTSDEPSRYITARITARTDLDAFAAWCKLFKVQDIPTTRAGDLIIKIVRPSPPTN